MIMENPSPWPRGRPAGRSDVRSLSRHNEARGNEAKAVVAGGGDCVGSAGGLDRARYTPPSVALPAKFRIRRCPDWDRSQSAVVEEFPQRQLLDLLQVDVERLNLDLAAAIAANDAAQAQAQAALSGLLPHVSGLGYVTSNKQSTNRPLCSAGQAKLLRRQPARRGLLRNRHLGSGQGHRGRGDRQRRGQHGRAGASPARTACRTRRETTSTFAASTIRSGCSTTPSWIYNDALGLTKSRLNAQIASPLSTSTGRRRS